MSTNTLFARAADRVASLLAAGTLIALAGCSKTTSTNIKTIADKTYDAATETNECDVALQLWYSPEGFESDKYAIVSEPKCVKRSDEAIRFDPNIKLFFHPRHSYPNSSDYAYCAGKSTPTDKEGIKTCSWNRKFRDAFPLSFRIWSPSGKRPLREFVQLVDVFRNGSLTYRSDVPHTAVLIDGDVLAGDGIPHLADFDLRLYPAGITLDQELLRREVRQGGDKLRRRFEIVGQVAFDELAGELKGEAKCLVGRVDAVRAELARLAGDPEPLPILQEQAAEGCNSARHQSSLQEKYEGLKGLAADTLKRRSDEIAEEVKSDLNREATYLRRALDDLWGRYNAAKDTKAADTMRRIDGLVVETLSAIDDAAVLATRISDDLQSFAKDDQRQLAAFRAVVKNLQDEGDFFEPYGSNPPEKNGEAIVKMAYADAFQFFFLTPWNGAAVRFADKLHTEPGVSYAIPILDGAGIRLQYGRSRWADTRLAVGTMVFEDNDQDNDPDAREVRWALQANVGISNLRFGLAWVPAAADQTEDSYFHNHFRMLLGVDLYKLITGRSLEAATEGF